MMTTSLLPRLRDEITRRMLARGWSRAQLSREAGLEDSYTKQVLSGKNQNPTLNTLERIAEAFGCGVLDLFGHENVVSLIEHAGEELAMIPTYDLKLSAGPGAFAVDNETPMHFQPFRYSWLRSITKSPIDNLILARVGGDSMWDTLHDGDQVLIDRSRHLPTRDGLYAIRWSDDLLIKRVTVDPRNGLLAISSDNSRYQTYREVNPNEIETIGRIMWIGRQV